MDEIIIAIVNEYFVYFSIYFLKSISLKVHYVHSYIVTVDNNKHTDMRFPF